MNKTPTQQIAIQGKFLLEKHDLLNEEYCYYLELIVDARTKVKKIREQRLQIMEQLLVLRKNLLEKD